MREIPRIPTLNFIFPRHPLMVTAVDMMLHKPDHWAHLIQLFLSSHLQERVLYQTLRRTVKNITNNIIGDKDWEEVNDNKDRSPIHQILNYSIHWCLAAIELHSNRARVKLFILGRCILSGASGFITLL